MCFSFGFGDVGNISTDYLAFLGRALLLAILLAV